MMMVQFLNFFQGKAYWDFRRNSKFQAPNHVILSGALSEVRSTESKGGVEGSKQIPIIKLQNPKHSRIGYFGNLNLEFGACLELGIWNLIFFVLLFCISTAQVSAASSLSSPPPSWALTGSTSLYLRLYDSTEGMLDIDQFLVRDIDEALPVDRDGDE